MYNEFKGWSLARSRKFAREKFVFAKTLCKKVGKCVYLQKLARIFQPFIGLGSRCCASRTMVHCNRQLYLGKVAEWASHGALQCCVPGGQDFPDLPWLISHTPGTCSLTLLSFGQKVFTCMFVYYRVGSFGGKKTMDLYSAGSSGTLREQWPGFSLCVDQLSQQEKGSIIK